MNEELLKKIECFAQKECRLPKIANALSLSEKRTLDLIQEFLSYGLGYYWEGNRFGKEIKVDGNFAMDNKLDHMIIISISDAHLGSLYDNAYALQYVGEKATRIGANFVLFSGDFTDGYSLNKDRRETLKITDFDETVEYGCSSYPMFECPSFFVKGNHDEKWEKYFGVDIVEEIAKKREDIIYLGGKNANLQLGELKIHLWHGDKYGKEYSQEVPCKYAARLAHSFYADILQIGHLHTHGYNKHGNTHIFQTGPLQDASPYFIEQGCDGIKSFWIIDVYFGDYGQVRQIKKKLEIIR